MIRYSTATVIIGDVYNILNSYLTYSYHLPRGNTAIEHNNTMREFESNLE